MNSMKGDDDGEGGDDERLEMAIAWLAEHFDTVQVFCSRYDGEKGETITTGRGTGNYFARVGQVKAWVIRMDEDEKETVRGG